MIEQIATVLHEKFGVQCSMPERDSWVPIARAAVSEADKITAATREAARPKIGHKRGCVTMNCLGCGSDYFSTDYR